MTRKSAPFKYPATAPAPRGPKSAADLMGRSFAPLRWTIADLLPEGCYLLAARPKIGKSWLGLQFGVAVTEAGYALGKKAEGGAVLYLALEDNERRLQARLAKHEIGQFGDIDQFYYETAWPRIDAGGAEMLEQWLAAHPDARLVVIDTLEKIRPERLRGGSVYADDYAATQALKALSDKYKVSILIIAHNKKGKAETGDPLELISGSMGLSGGCDGALVIERPRGSETAKLYVIGRDIEDEPEDGYVIRFDRPTCKWEMVGNAVALGASAAQQSVLDAIRAAGQPQTAAQVGKDTRRGVQAARHIINRLVAAGKLVEIEGSKPIQFDIPVSAKGEA